MRRVFILSFIVALALLLAAPAYAHPGHRSCAGGPNASFELGLIPVGPGPDFGPFNKAIGVNHAEALAGAHAGTCA